MLASIVNLLLGPGSGILTGLFGTAIQGGLKAWGDKQRFAHELAMRGKDIEAMQVEHQLRLAEAEARYGNDQALANIDLAKAEAAADADVRAASYGNDRAAYYDGKATGLVAQVVGLLMGVVDFLRGVIRPGTAIYLLAVVSAFGFSVWFHTELAQADATEILKRIIFTLLYLTETAITWYFGARAISRMHSGKAA